VNAGGERSAAGMVDMTGSGVPRKLCTRNVVPIVIIEGTITALIIAARSDASRRASRVQSRIIKAPMKNV